MSRRMGCLLSWVVLLAACDRSEPEPQPQPPLTSDAGTPDSGSDAGTPPPTSDAGTPDSGTDAGTSGPVGGGDWSQYRAGPEGTWALTGSFTRAQAAGVTPLWTAAAGSQGYVQPLVVGDTVYVTTGYDAKVLALDARSGAQRWERTLDYSFTDPCQVRPLRPGFWAAPALVNGVLYAASPDGSVYGLDAASGTTVHAWPVATPQNPPEFIQSSPAVSSELGRLYVGVASLFTCHHVPGRVISVDVSTGAVRSLVLTEAERAGSGVWSSLAVDAPARRVYVTTGDPVGQPLAEQPNAQAMLELDADTLAVLGRWQNPGPGPDANSDFGASPTLFTAADGTKLVGSANKDGWVYVFRRGALSAGPVWKYQVAVGGPDPLQGQGSLVAPGFAHGLLYVAGGTTPEGEPGSVVALDPGTGAVRWKHTTPGYVFAGMPVLGEVLVVVSNAADSSKSWLELLEARTGESLKRFELTGPTYGAPTVGKGLILVYPYSGQLRAFSIPAP